MFCAKFGESEMGRLAQLAVKTRLCKKYLQTNQKEFV